MLLYLLLAIPLALAWSPTDSYAPGGLQCPPYLRLQGNSVYSNVTETGEQVRYSNSSQYAGSLVRAADSLSHNESVWVSSRQARTNEALKQFLGHANLTDFDADQFVDSATSSLHNITIGVAFSGGGYRAMLSGAGQLSALDNRTEGAWEDGLGGLIESATYITGLSGGNWMLGTVAWNNWTSVQDIIDQDEIWDLENSIFNPGGVNIFRTVSYWDDISDDLDDKREAGFNVSLTDPWGRALSHQFFPTLDDAGAAYTWSSLREADVFSSQEMPFPIVVANGRTPGSVILNENSTVFEVSPLELGSWDPSLHAFTDVKYIGTNVTNGVPDSGECIGGLDNAGFIMGTSSSLFNQFLLQINTTSISGTLRDIINDFLTDLAEEDNDIAVYHPNPFFGASRAAERSIVTDDTLFLVDGGEDLQNIPLAPLIQPQRGVDVMFAYDNSADTAASWPNGASVVASYQRQFAAQGNGTTFPYVPDTNSFLNLNLTARPVFFGCDASNLTTLQDDGLIPPLMVYTANRPFSFWSNTSTFKMSYDQDEKTGMIQNGFEVASRLNSTLDEEWRTCVACAIIRREQERNNQTQSEQCSRCFQSYCWDGSLDASSQPAVNFTDEGLTNAQSELDSAGSFQRGVTNIWMVLVAVMAVVVTC